MTRSSSRFARRSRRSPADVHATPTTTNDVQPPRARKARHGRGEEVLEDGVGGGEEDAEQQEERQAERQPACDAGDARRPQPPPHLAPRHLALHQLGCADDRRRTRGHGARDVVVDVRVRDPALGAPQRADRDGAADRQQVRRLEKRRRVPREQRREQHERRGHPPAALVERHLPDAEQNGERDDERDRPEAAFTPSGRPLKQHVREHSQHEPGDADGECDPFLHLHGRLC